MPSRLYCAVALIVTALSSSTPAASAEIVLRAVSAFAEKTYAARPFELFIERVNAAGGWQEKTKYRVDPGFYSAGATVVQTAGRGLHRKQAQVGQLE
jgi:hypothetical protein